MGKYLFVCIVSAFLLTGCQEETNPYLIGKDRVGVLSKTTKVNQLDSIYSNDSLVRQIDDGEYFRRSNEIKVYDSNGDYLLLLEPVQAFDSTSTIGFIQVMDPRFKTAEGLSIESTFKDIVENYEISRIENTLSAAVVFIDELNAYISIDKKELPSELRYNNEIRLQPSQIPNDAEFKYFMIGWN